MRVGLGVDFSVSPACEAGEYFPFSLYHHGRFSNIIGTHSWPVDSDYSSRARSVSLSVAYYDLDDDRAPALWFEDGEISEFFSDLRDAQSALADYTEQ